MNNIFEIKKFYIIIFIISLLSLLIALYIEFFLGYRPCKLCIYQRIPYLIAIFLTFLGISYSKNFIWLYALLLIFFSSFLLSGYHLGIEQEIFEDIQGFCVDTLDPGTYKLNDTFRKTSKANQKKVVLQHNVMGNIKSNWQRAIFRNSIPFTATGSIYLINHDDVVTLHLMYKRYITKSQKVVTFDELE